MIKGSIVAIVTPMLENGSIDTAAFTSLIEKHITDGTSAIVVGGTTGESATLTNSEFTDLLKLSLKVANNRIPIIAGTGTNSTQATIEKTKLAAELGVNSVLVVAPYYNKPTQEGLYLHFAEISKSVDIPVILYNVPSRTSSDILPETVVKLSKIKNIIGIKEATGDLERLKFLKQNCAEDFIFYSGDDETSLDFMLLGGDGVISVTSNVAPKLMSEMCTKAFSNDIDKAKTIDSVLQGLHKNLMIESNPIPVKWALQHLGQIKSGIRLPLTTLTTESQQKLQIVLDKIDLG